ncbi:universal stress protein, partial [Streptomyces sp. NPDC057623]|uniref:universal stress protein n=1 Tax=Streptomyces sp. NPDC057623 TaxID=3346187 RepID=UPI003674C727
MAIPLVVGVDGSEASLEAVDWAADEAVRHAVPLHLLHAAARDHEVSDVIGHALERATERVPAVRLSSEVLHEDAASALVDKGRNAFALVLGSRGCQRPFVCPGGGQMFHALMADSASPVAARYLP